MSWSVEHRNVIKTWLEKLGLAQDYSQAFIDNGYDDLDVCRQIGDADLDAIGVTTADDRANLLKAVSQLQECCSGTTGAVDLAGRTDAASNNATAAAAGAAVYFTLENPDSCTESIAVDRLSSLISDRLTDDAVSLTAEPYLSQEGKRNESALRQLAVRYSAALNVNVDDVSRCLQSLQSRARLTTSADLDNPAAAAATSPLTVDVSRHTQCQCHCQCQSATSNRPLTSDTSSESRFIPDVKRSAATVQAASIRSSLSSSFSRMLKNVSLRRVARKYTYRQHEGDLSASEMTMSDEDRMQLMLLVKEGKISVQEAVDTVKKYRMLAQEEQQLNANNSNYCIQTRSLVEANQRCCPAAAGTKSSKSSIGAGAGGRLTVAQSMLPSVFRRQHAAANDSTVTLDTRCCCTDAQYADGNYCSSVSAARTAGSSAVIVESMSADLICPSGTAGRHSTAVNPHCRRGGYAEARGGVTINKSVSLHNSACPTQPPPRDGEPDHRRLRPTLTTQSCCHNNDPHHNVRVQHQCGVFERTTDYSSNTILASSSLLSSSSAPKQQCQLNSDNQRLNSCQSNDSLANTSSCGGGCCTSCSSSPSSSVSATDIEHQRPTSTMKYLFRARCRNDYTTGGATTPINDSDALRFKKNDIIYVLDVLESGLCRGVVRNHIGGLFHLSDVETLSEEAGGGTLLAASRRAAGKARSPRRTTTTTTTTTTTRPKTVEELLHRLGLQRLVSVFLVAGLTSLAQFSELDEEDLDELNVVQCEDRAKLLTAAQLLHDYENEGYESCSSRSTASQSSPACTVSSQDAACQTSSANSSPPPLRDGAAGDVIVTSCSSSNQHPHAPAAVGKTGVAVDGTPASSLPSLSQSQRVVNGVPSHLLRSRDCRHVISSQPQQQQQHRSTLTTQHRQLVQSMTRMLDIDGVDLSRHPYTNYVTGESGVPASLIRHYSTALQCGRSEAILAMEDCRQRALMFSKPTQKPVTSSSVALAIPDSDSLVCDWLKSLGMAMYTSQFASQRLTRVGQLVGLSRQDLQALGVTSRQHVDLLAGAIDAVRNVQSSADDCNRRSTTSTDHISQSPAAGLMDCHSTILSATRRSDNYLHSPTGVIDRV